MLINYNNFIIELNKKKFIKLLYLTKILTIYSNFIKVI